MSRVVRKAFYLRALDGSVIESGLYLWLFSFGIFVDVWRDVVDRSSST